MSLEQTLRHLKQIVQLASANANPVQSRPKPLPAQRYPRGIEEYVHGAVASNDCGECFAAEQALPLGRPFGNTRIGDIVTADLSALAMILGECPLNPERLLFLDTETTGLLDGSGSCAFLMGIGFVHGSEFVVRQFFLRDYSEEPAALAALADAIRRSEALVTFNGRSFDAPLLEQRFRLHGQTSPFSGKPHCDMLHPARTIWKRRLGSCKLTRLESGILGVERKGDVPGSEIPGIYFDYLRTGDARGLQPVFFHNALDIVSLAALTAAMAGFAKHSDNAARRIHGADLLGLGVMYERAGALDLAAAALERALAADLPEALRPEALWRLASLHKRLNRLERAAEIWLDLSHGEALIAIRALGELARHHERCRKDYEKALRYAEQAIERLGRLTPGESCPAGLLVLLTRRCERLRKRLAASVP